MLLSTIVLYILCCCFDTSISLDKIPISCRDFLGMGYSVTSGNPESSFKINVPNVDPGWRVPLVMKLHVDFSKETGDGRYSIPGNTEAPVITDQCSFNSTSYIFSGDKSYTNKVLFGLIKFENNSNDESFLNSSAFSESPTYNQFHRSIYNQKHTFVNSNGKCPIYNYKFNFSMKQSVGDAFSADIDKLPLWFNASQFESAYYRVIDTYGTHYTTSVTVGSRYSRTYEFDQSSWNQMNWNKWDITLLGDAEYSVATNTTNENGTPFFNSTILNEAAEYAKLKYGEVHTSSIGINPVKRGISIVKNWINETIISPVPYQYTLGSILHLLTVEYFNHFEKSRIVTIHDNMKIALKNYCNHSKLLDCAYHLDDLISMKPSPRNKTISSSGSISCNDSHSVVVSCGIQTANTASKYDKYWGIYPNINTYASCIGHDSNGAVISAVCTANNPTQTINSKPMNRSNPYVIVPCKLTGHQVTGCGINTNDTGESTQMYQRSVYPNGATSCKCYNEYGGECYALCSQDVAVHPTPLQNQSSNGGEYLTITCPEPEIAFGCGIDMEAVSNAPPNYQRVPTYYNSDWNQCTGFSESPYTLYAICGVMTNQ